MGRWARVGWAAWSRWERRCFGFAAAVHVSEAGAKGRSVTSELRWESRFGFTWEMGTRKMNSLACTQPG